MATEDRVTCPRHVALGPQFIRWEDVGKEFCTIRVKLNPASPFAHHASRGAKAEGPSGRVY